MSLGADTRTDLEATLRRELSGHPEIELALLFGSQARDRARPDSDVDVAISAQPFDRLGLIHDLSAATGRTVDVDLDRASYVLNVALLRDGVLLHQADRHAEARWRVRTDARRRDRSAEYGEDAGPFLRQTAKAAGV